MVKLNRTTDYGLIARSYIRAKTAGEESSAREIADHFKLPFEILAKTLQKLKEHGLITSSYGTRGGYILARDLSTLNLTEFLGMMEGPVSVVACTHPTQENPEHEAHHCEYISQCNIKKVMTGLNSKVTSLLAGISVEELTRTMIKGEVVAL